jgi:hypothetical protein
LSRPIPRKKLLVMKIGLLGKGFGVAHAHIYHGHPRVERLVVFGRTPAKVEALATELGVEATTDIDSIYHDPDIDLVDVCLPTALHADLPTVDAYRAVIDHVIGCCEGGAESRLDPASVLDSLAVTHEIHEALTGG